MKKVVFILLLISTLSAYAYTFKGKLIGFNFSLNGYNLYFFNRELVFLKDDGKIEILRYVIPYIKDCYVDQGIYPYYGLEVDSTYEVSLTQVSEMKNFSWDDLPFYYQNNCKLLWPGMSSLIYEIKSDTIPESFSREWEFYVIDNRNLLLMFDSITPSKSNPMAGQLLHFEGGAPWLRDDFMSDSVPSKPTE